MQVLKLHSQLEHMVPFPRLALSPPVFGLPSSCFSLLAGSVPVEAPAVVTGRWWRRELSSFRRRTEAVVKASRAPVRKKAHSTFASRTKANCQAHWAVHPRIQQYPMAFTVSSRSFVFPIGNTCITTDISCSRKMTPQIMNVDPVGVMSVWNLADTSALLGPNRPKIDSAFTVMRPTYPSALASLRCFMLFPSLPFPARIALALFARVARRSLAVVPRRCSTVARATRIWSQGTRLPSSTTHGPSDPFAVFLRRKDGLFAVLESVLPDEPEGHPRNEKGYLDPRILRGIYATLTGGIGPGRCDANPFRMANESCDVPRP
eukprot:scaffold45_cov337-Pavlova_lutheri.AAC.32